MSDILTSVELVALTCKKMPYAQRRVLTHMRVPFVERLDGTLVVARLAQDQALGVITESNRKHKVTLNFEGI